MKNKKRGLLLGYGKIRKSSKKTQLLQLVSAIFMVPILLIAFLFSDFSTDIGQAAFLNNKQFIPFVMNQTNYYRNSRPLLLGLYAKGWVGDQNVVDAQLNDLGSWSGVKLTFAGTFTDINEPNYDAAINMQLEKMYSNGYTPFINILPKISAYNYAKGDADQYIRLWARAYKQVVQSDNRVGYIALMPEMNGNWVPYGTDPGNYKLSLIRTQRIFKEEGVPDAAVQWVFAPNGWSTSSNMLEYYYPGDEYIDVIGFSAYNYGYCTYPNYSPQWNSLESITKEYIERIRKMAPSKPIFISQISTSAKENSGINDEAKNQWIRDGYEFLLESLNVRAVIYFNIDDEICDMAIWRTWPTSFAKSYQGYMDIVQSSGIKYMSPSELFKNPILP